MVCHEQGSGHRRGGVLGDGSTRVRAMAGPGPMRHLPRQGAAFRRGCRPRPVGAWALGREAVPQPRVEAGGADRHGRRELGDARSLGRPPGGEGGEARLRLRTVRSRHHHRRGRNGRSAANARPEAHQATRSARSLGRARSTARLKLSPCGYPAPREPAILAIVMASPPLVQLNRQRPAQTIERKPSWLKVPAPGGPNYLALKHLMRDLRLHTVCEEAHCPNIGECWEHRAATFMILGDVCTRNCAYCAVAHGTPAPLDTDEPARLAAAVQQMALRHVVITSVDRDDLPNGGAEIFAAAIAEIRRRTPETSVEVLIPDFKGNERALGIVVEARPDILNHNLETIERLYRLARPGGRYQRALELLGRAKAMDSSMLTKSGTSCGPGEGGTEWPGRMRARRGRTGTI